MTRFILFLVLFTSLAAQAQERYAFGPKKGQLVVTEEEKARALQEQSLLQLQRMEELMKAAQVQLETQSKLIEEQNKMLGTLITLEQQSQQMQLQQLQQQQLQPAVIPQITP
jgi:hypothetical protein